MKQNKFITDNYIKQIKEHPANLTHNGFMQYVQDCGGISNVRKEDLDKILYETNQQILNFTGFTEIYNQVVINESGKFMNKWAVIAGVSAIISALIALANLFLYLAQ